MAALRANLNIVLHQVKSPDNLGAVARVMANFGLSRLILSEAQTYDFKAAEKMAVRAEHVLARMELERSLPYALQEVVYACGTTSRSVRDRPALSPEEGAQRLLEHSARGRVALVLGGEKRGLSDADLALCQDVVAIPTDSAVQPSLNLAQAAAILLYQCARVDLPLVAPGPARPEEGAPLGLVQALERKMGSVLLGAGFLNPQAPEYVLNELLRGLLRGAPSRREIELWKTAFDQLGRHFPAAPDQPKKP